MEFQEYEKDGRVISATETAYHAIYEAQGFKPRSPIAPKGGKRGGKEGSDSGDRDEGATLDEGLLTFYVEKLVADILAYCHRSDFPDALIYSAVDLIRKHLADEESSAD